MSAHDVDHLVRQFERVWFEAHAAGSDVEQEAEVDVHDVSFAVKHNVAVVAIADLENVADDGVGCHGLDKVEAGLLERDAVLVTVAVLVKVAQVVDLGAAHFVARCGVGHDINDAAAGRGGGDAIRIEVHVESDGHEDVFELRDDLQGEHVLTAVVSDLEDGALPHIDVRRVVGVLALRDGATHFERSHERGLGGRLERAAGRAVDVDDGAVGVGWQVHTFIHGDLGHFLVNLGLLFRLGALDVWTQRARDAGDLFEEGELALVVGLCLARELADNALDHGVERGFEGVLDFCQVVLVLVRLHVPDDLVAEELGDERRMEDELSDVAMCVLAQGLDELGHVEKDQVDGVLRERAHRVLQDHGVAAAAVGREQLDRVDGRDGRPREQPAERAGCGLLREEQRQRSAAMRHAVGLGADKLGELGAQLGLGEALDHVHGDAWVEAPGRVHVGAMHLHAGRCALGMLRRMQPHEQARLFAGVERLQQMEALLDVLDGTREGAVRDEELGAVQHRVLRGVGGRRRHKRVGSQRRVAQQGEDGAHVQEFLGAAAQVAAIRPHGRLREPGEGEAADGIAQTGLDEHVETRGLEHAQTELHERRVGVPRERMQAQCGRGIGHVQDEAAEHGDERGIAAARALEAVAEQLEHEEVAAQEVVGEPGLAGDARGVRGGHVRLAGQRGLSGQLRRVQAAALARGGRPVLGDGAHERAHGRRLLGEQPRPGARRGEQRCLRTHLHRHPDERRQHVGVGRGLLHEQGGAAVHEAVERVVGVQRGVRLCVDLRAERGLGRRGRPAERRALHEQRVRDVARVVAAHVAEADALRAAARDVQREGRAEAVGGRVGLQVAQERAVQRAGHVGLDACEDIAHAARHALEQGAAVRVHVREVDRHAGQRGGEGVLRHERRRQLAVAAVADERHELEHRRDDLGARKQPGTRRHEALEVRVRLVTHRRARVAQRHEHVARFAREARVGRVRAAALRHMHEERGERALDDCAQRRVHGRRREARVHEVAQRHRRTAARRAAPLDMQHGIHEREARVRQRARLERAVAEDGRQRVAQRVRRRRECVVAQHIVRVDVVVQVVARRRGQQRRRLERDRV